MTNSMRNGSARRSTYRLSLPSFSDSDGHYQGPGAGVAVDFNDARGLTQRSSARPKSSVSTTELAGFDEGPQVHGLNPDATSAPRQCGQFADRLNQLFEVVHPPGRRPFRAAEVVSLINARGIRLSGAYLSQLRSGRRKRPSAHVIAALADVFGVDYEYLSGTHPGYSAAIDEELVWLRMANDRAVRDLTTRILELPPASQDEVLAFADSLRQSERAKVLEI